MTEEKTFFLLTEILKKDNAEDRLYALRELTDLEWRDMVNMAAKQAVISLLFHQLKVKDMLTLVPVDVRDTLVKNFRGNAFNNMRHFKTLLVIARAFQSAGIEMIVLKGAHVAKAIYPNIGLRQMGDLDLLVRKEKVREAASIIMELGYKPKNPFSLEWDLVDWHHHLPPFSRDGSIEIELHWNAMISPPPKFDVIELWDDAISFPLEDWSISCLSPEDLLVHICIHNSYQHHFEFTLIPYCDIQRIIAHFSSSLDWKIVVAKTRRWSMEKGVHLTLRFACEQLGAQVPNEVLDQLSVGENHELIYSLIRPQILAASTEPTMIVPNLARFNRLPFWGKITLMQKRFFPSRIEIAFLYNVSPESLSVYFKYPLRWLFLIREYRTLVADVTGGNSILTDVADRKGQIIEWLSEDTKF